MHIEPGVLAVAKVAVANAVALPLAGCATAMLMRRPQLLVRAALAATFFSLFMQAFHMKIGPSELHFVGAMPIYLTLGVAPTLLGFALGLLFQAWIFEPADLAHLSVNFLSLAVPLLVVHHGLGRKLRSIHCRDVLRLDGVYYAGVVLMVGFWLSIGEVGTPLEDWLRFASAYLAVVLLEPMVSVTTLALLRRWRCHAVVKTCFALHPAA